jgi:DNA-binding response OmpR family regulator
MMETKKKLLICEDEVQLCEIYRDYFSSRNFDVVCAFNGEEGLELFATEKPDIVLLDMRMPKLDGYGTLKRLRKTDNNVPVIIITAYGYIHQVIQMMNLGISGYVTKPVDYDRLHDKVMEILSLNEGETNKE